MRRFSRIPIIVIAVVFIIVVTSCGDDDTTNSGSNDVNVIVDSDIPLYGTDYASWSTVVDPNTGVQLRCLWAEENNSEGSGSGLWCYDPGLRQAIIELAQALRDG